MRTYGRSERVREYDDLRRQNLKLGKTARMLKYGKEYVKQSMEEYERKVKEQVERALRRKAAALGYELVAKPAPEPARA